MHLIVMSDKHATLSATTNHLQLPVILLIILLHAGYGNYGSTPPPHTVVSAIDEAWCVQNQKCPQLLALLAFLTTLTTEQIVAINPLMSSSTPASPACNRCCCLKPGQSSGHTCILELFAVLLIKQYTYTSQRYPHTAQAILCLPMTTQQPKAHPVLKPWLQLLIATPNTPVMLFISL